MLDEQSVQLSRPLVEHLERPHLQDVAGIVEPGESRAKHRQILRDPGWLLKWIGSLLICTGIFMLFYMKQFRRPTPGVPRAASHRRRPEAGDGRAGN
jgi:hypothetical protein